MEEQKEQPKVEEPKPVQIQYPQIVIRLTPEGMTFESVGFETSLQVLNLLNEARENYLMKSFERRLANEIRRQLTVHQEMQAANMKLV